MPEHPIPYEATQLAILREYGAEMLAAHGRVVPGFFTAICVRSEALRDPDGLVAPRGYLVELVGIAAQAVRHDGFRYLGQVDGAAIAALFEIWEARVWLPDHPTVFWSKRWTPGFEGSAEYHGDPLAAQLTTTQTSTLALGVEVFARLPTAPRGRKPHRQVSMDPAEWRLVMTFVKQCVADGCTWPQVVARLETRQLDDPDFPSVTATRKQLKRWLTWYERDLRGY